MARPPPYVQVVNAAPHILYLITPYIWFVLEDGTQSRLEQNAVGHGSSY